MTVTSLRPWTVNGVNLQTLATNIVSIDGWDGFPGKRGRNLAIPYRHGSFSMPRKSYNEKRFVLQMAALSTDADGDITHAKGGYGHLYDNVDALLGLFHSNDYLDVRRTMPDLTVRQADCEVLEAFPVGGGNTVRQMAVLMRIPGVFWNELPVEQDVTSSLTTTGSVVLATGGNAPIGDAIITIDNTADGSNPSLTHTNGESLSIADAATSGDDYVIDMGTRTIKKNGTNLDAALTLSRGWWLELPPATPTYTLTWAATSGTWNVTVDWYNKWF